MLHLLIDTSVWLDLAQKRDGLHVSWKKLELLVPQVVLDEFGRNLWGSITRSRLAWST